MGWWRRNRWGLIGLIPALLIVGGLSAERLIILRDREPTAVPVDAQGWSTLEGGRVRLISLGPALDLFDYAGEAYTVDPHVAIWVVRLELDAPKGAVLRICRVILEDERERHYNADPSDELDGTRNARTQNCQSKDDEASQYFSSSFFALPRDARPVAVRVIVEDRATFVRLPIA